MRSTLKQLGCKDENIHDTDTGESALKILKNNAVRVLGEAGSHIDLVISDWHMPGMNGLELLKRIRAERNLRSILFVMVTVEDNHTNIMRAVSEGVNQYIVKPFTAKIIAEKLDKMFQQELKQ